MKKPLIFSALLSLLFITVHAQNPGDAYGQVSRADLELKRCSFEPDANAEVLAENCHVYYKGQTVVLEYFKRVKIFNDKADAYAKVRIPYYGGPYDESVSDVQAETVNLTDDRVTYMPVDKPLIFDQKIDKLLKTITFAFPAVKAGSVIECKYKWSSNLLGNFPQWLVQESIPVRHTEFKAEFSQSVSYNYIWHVTQEFSRDTDYFTNGKNAEGGQTHIWALDSVPSLKHEPFMTPVSENQEHVLFQAGIFLQGSWNQIAYFLSRGAGFGKELDPKIVLDNEQAVLDSIRSKPTRDAQVAYVYTLVKNAVHYNNKPGIFTEGGIRSAWTNKIGNAAEINFIVYHFLKNSGFEPSLVIFDPESNVDRHYPSPEPLRKVAVSLEADSGKYYVLDASNPDAGYKDIPYEALNRTAFRLNPSKGLWEIVPLVNPNPQAESISINADITPDGKLSGTTQIRSWGYNKTSVKKRYREDGESKYIEYLQDGNNQLKISSLKMANAASDNLPLIQDINFKLDYLPGSDANYIYLDPTLFTRFGINPFLARERVSDIDFRYLPALTITGRYKIPAHFKAEAIPEPELVMMPDKSIVLKRVISEENGYLIVKYSLDFSNSYFRKEDYPAIREFYRKVFGLLHEQIALKKT